MDRGKGRGSRDLSADTWLQYLFIGLPALACAALLFTWFLPARMLLWPLLGLSAAGVLSWPRRPSPLLLGPIVLAALVSLGPISSRDSMSYHHDLVHLLARGGLPPGLAWIHGRFGWPSSWFALHACFEQEALGLAGRVDTLGNGALLALALCHLGVSFRRWLSGTADAATRFAALAWTLVLPLPIYLNYANSPTPDFPVIVYTIVLAWMLLRAGDGVDRVAQARLALLLGGFAIALKPSAVPLAVAAALAGLRREGLTRGLIGTILIAALPVLVGMTSAWLASGYPLFPATWNPVPVDWQLPRFVADQNKAAIQGFAYWGQAFRPDTLEGVEIFSLRWLRHWLFADPVNTLGGLAFGLSLLALPPLLRRAERRRAFSDVLPLACAGIALMALLAPAPRFGWGFLLLLPAAWLAGSLPACPAWPARLREPLAAVLLVGLVSPTWLRPTRSERRMQNALRGGIIQFEPQVPWLRPPVIPHLHFDDGNDAAYLPDPERSHNRPGNPSVQRATWYPTQSIEGGEFRDPDRGWRRGFRAAMVPGAQTPVPSAVRGGAFLEGSARFEKPYLPGEGPPPP